MSKPPVLILCGGKGTRLGALTASTPKPLVPVCGIPILRRIVESLSLQGFHDISLLIKPEQTAAFQAEPIINICQFKYDRSGLDLSQNVNFYKTFGSWVLNGDTLLTGSLPENLTRTTVLTHNDVSSGAIFYAAEPVQVMKCGKFYDMGSLEGLRLLEAYLSARK